MFVCVVVEKLGWWVLSWMDLSLLDKGEEGVEIDFLGLEKVWLRRWVQW